MAQAGDTTLKEWIALHYNDDLTRLRLRYHGDPLAEQAIMQIECRRKAGSRIPSAITCDDFIFPTYLSAEQATSEPLARLHADLAGYQPGSRHLDLTCGLGIDAFEAARRGAKVTAIDLDPVVAAAATSNAIALGLQANFSAINADSNEFVTTTDSLWDCIFIDPARRNDSGRKLTALADCSPDVTAILPRLLELAPKIIIKASPMLDISATATELNASAAGKGRVTRLITIGTARECKETLAIVERGATGSYQVEAATILPVSEKCIIFEASSERSSEEIPTVEELPLVGDCLYEPYPAVMKTAAWGALAALDPNLRQLHPNTHLFTSPTTVPTFPGIQTEIKRVEILSDRSLRSIAREYPKINVSTRNFIISAPELAKRLRVKEGGDMRLYGVRCGRRGQLAIIVSS